MELSPKLIEDVEFKQAFRGYDPDQVDDFLEQVAREVGGLLERLRRAEERSVEVEREVRSVGDSEETLRRTLVLAQRTADAAIAEARERADAIVGEAEARAGELTAEADERRRVLDEEAVTRRREADEYALQVRSDADDHVMRVTAEVTERARVVTEETAERTRVQVAQAEERVAALHREADDLAGRLAGEAEERARLRAAEVQAELDAQIAALTSTRDGLRRDIEAFDAHLTQQRGAVAEAAAVLTRLLEDPHALALAPLPLAPEPEPEPEVAEVAELVGAPAPPGEAEPVLLVVAEAPTPDDAAGPEPAWSPGEPVAAQGGSADGAPEPLAPEVVPEWVPHRWADETPADLTWGTASPPSTSPTRTVAPEGAPVADGLDESTQAVPVLRSGDDLGEDPFLAELRRAIDDPEPLGPRDEVGERDEEDEESLRRRLFRR